MSEIPGTCPHCGSELVTWRVPDGASWEDDHFFVCFNDECSYYKGGWKWMKEQYNQDASYRYTWIPSMRASSMIPVWSDEAARQMIVCDKGGGCG